MLHKVMPLASNPLMFALTFDTEGEAQSVLTLLRSLPAVETARINYATEPCEVLCMLVDAANKQVIQDAVEAVGVDIRGTLEGIMV